MSWATSRILESLEFSLSHFWPAFRYQSAMLSIRMGLIWMLGQVHTGVMMGRQEDLKEDEDEDEDYLEELAEQLPHE